MQWYNRWHWWPCLVAASLSSTITLTGASLIHHEHIVFPIHPSERPTFRPLTPPAYFGTKTWQLACR